MGGENKQPYQRDSATTGPPIPMTAAGVLPRLDTGCRQGRAAPGESETGFLHYHAGDEP